MRNSEISQRIAESVAILTPHRATVSRFCVYEEKVSRFHRVSPRILEEIILASSLSPIVTLHKPLMLFLRHNKTLSNTFNHQVPLYVHYNTKEDTI